MNNKTFRDNISKQCGFTPNKAKHRQDLRVKLSPQRLAYLESICTRHPGNKAKQGAIPESFEAWLKSNQDSIDIYDAGGNWTPDKVQSNHDQYDQHLFDAQEEQRARWDAEREAQEHENDLRWESRESYESDQLAGNPPEGEGL